MPEEICDAHVHLGESGPWQPYDKPTILIRELIGLFDKYRVERAVVFPNPNVGDEYPAMNDYIAYCVKKHPKRLIGFGRTDPRRGEDAIRELVRIKEKLNLTGLKLHPMVECFRPDHPFFAQFFRKTAELNLPILFHTGEGFSSPGLIAPIAEKYPKLPIILGHLKEGCLSVMKNSENVYVETSGAIPEIIELAVKIDADRVLFGSDAPYYRYPTQVATIDAARISSKERRKVYHDNLCRLFK